MLTSKERSNLRSIAQKIEPVTQVGKLGINDALIESLDKAIEKREIIKVDSNKVRAARNLAKIILERETGAVKSICSVLVRLSSLRSLIVRIGIRVIEPLQSFCLPALS